MGIVGVCPNCTLLNAKVCADDGGCPYDRVVNGVLWSVGCDWRDDAGNCFNPVRAQVINISLSGQLPSQLLQEAIDKAWSRGAVVACAAGNDNSNQPRYPVAYTNCIARAATDSMDRRASFSNYGASWVDVAAPGAGVLSSVVSGGYEAWNGTAWPARTWPVGRAAVWPGSGQHRGTQSHRIQRRLDRRARAERHPARGRRVASTRARR